ncbi:MAG: zinc-dependent metalloprotease family protein [Planctomycetota bacterium]|nr:zinc-dependent metalloprotease family protein [Planctomycetota bacterium]
MLHRPSIAVLSTALGLTAATMADRPGSPPAGSEALGLEQATAVVVPQPIVDAASRSARIVVPPEDGELALRLHRHDVRAEGFQFLLHTGRDRFESIEPLPVETYRGLIEGDAGSLAAVSIHPDGIAGRIRTSEGRELWIEPAPVDPRKPVARRHLVYETTDIRETGARCGVVDGPAAPVLEDRPVGPPPSQEHLRQGGLCNAQIVIDCDFPFFERMGEDLDTLGRRVELVLNTMNLQYNTEVGIDHRLTAIVVRTTSGVDPYVGDSLCSGPGDLEDQVAMIWSPPNQPSIERDIAHLFTGRSTGNVVGCNFVGQVCDDDPYGASAIDYNGNLASSTDLLAHELGHGWGAGHCACSSPDYTMNAILTNANRFRPDVTIPVIRTYRDDNGDCLDCGGAPTVGCGNPANSCYSASALATPHCRDEDCCIVMCALDPFCCDTECDETCAEQALVTCARCGEPDAGTPFQPNGTPGCSELECCEAICGIDPFCCETEWDQKCADKALATCGGCGDPDGGSPFQEHVFGTSDAECCETICLADPFCCLTSWDAFCVRDALEACAGCGEPESGSAFLNKPEPGSDALACCEEICPIDPFCCSNRWDDQCAARAALTCGGWCAGDLNFDGKVAGDDLGLLVAEWNSVSAELADLNDDGIVDGGDLGVFLGNWGDCGY